MCTRFLGVALVVLAMFGFEDAGAADTCSSATMEITGTGLSATDARGDWLSKARDFCGGTEHNCDGTAVLCVRLNSNPPAATNTGTQWEVTAVATCKCENTLQAFPSTSGWGLVFLGLLMGGTGLLVLFRNPRREINRLS